MHRYRIRRNEAHRFIPPGHQGIVEWEYVGPGTSGAEKVSVWIGELSEGGVAEPHSHDVEEQVYHVLEGAVKIIIGDEGFEARAGDDSFYFVPPETSHAVYAMSPQAKVLVITSPAVRIE
jgi:quercetin dioxygenase-like cupin family protein